MQSFYVILNVLFFLFFFTGNRNPTNLSFIPYQCRETNWHPHGCIETADRKYAFFYSVFSILIIMSSILLFSFVILFPILSMDIDYIEDRADEIVSILVYEGIYEILSEVFEKETDETLLVCSYQYGS